MPDPWHDNNQGKETYKDAGIIDDPKVAQALVDLDLAHWLDKGRTWSRPNYAYNAAHKTINSNYFQLVKITQKGEVAWAVVMLKNSAETTSTLLSPPKNT